MIFVLHPGKRYQQLNCVGHQVLATDKAEYRYLVVLVEDTECTENLVDSRAAGGDIVNHQHILLPYLGTLGMIIQIKLCNLNNLFCIIRRKMCFFNRNYLNAY